MEQTYIIVLVTVSSKQEGEKIAHFLLEKKLIACANIIGPVSSHFHWSGKIETAKEYVIILKSKQKLFGEICKAVKAMHSYEVPEIIALPIIEGSNEYLDWMRSCLR